MPRLTQLFQAAARLQNPADPLGRRLRERLIGGGESSVEGIEWALIHCLEAAPDPAERARVASVVPRCEVAHVVLSSTVFVAALRAIALALIAAPKVYVKPSKRRPEMVELLAQAAPGLFDVVDTLRPNAGDHVWAYGSDESLAAIEASLPEGVVFHPHGFGIGVAVVDLALTWADASLLCRDLVAFDQRGCLSPRMLLLLATRAQAQRWLEQLGQQLDAFARLVPRGTLGDDERAQLSWYRSTVSYVGEFRQYQAGSLGITWDGRTLLLPPPGRHLHVCIFDGVPWQPCLEALNALVTAVGCSPSGLEPEVARLCPHARVSALGRMQSPPFDGPVDRRPARS